MSVKSGNFPSRPITLHPGALLWAGEHWILSLRPEGSDGRPSELVSLFHTRYSPAGEGNAALVRIHGNPGFHALCTDNPELAQHLTERFFSRVDDFSAELPTVHAAFQRTGDIRSDPAWVIQTGDHRLLARWHVSDAPVIADGTFRPGTEHFTVLFFTEKADLEFDGLSIPGRPFLRDIWKPSIGGARSSCVFALSETLIELPG